MPGEADRRNSEMTVAPERPCASAPAPSATRLIDVADMAAQALPGHRVEILGGQLTVNPPADGPHGESLSDLMAPLFTAQLHCGETRVIQGIGIWLPSGPSDHAVPDLAVVDADYRDHLVKFKCYDPAPFRLVVEITSSNWRTDVEEKPGYYASAGVPCYLIGDRKHGEVILHTEPREGEYRTCSRYKPGETFTLPAEVGAEIELESDALLRT